MKRCWYLRANRKQFSTDANRAVRSFRSVSAFGQPSPFFITKQSISL